MELVDADGNPILHQPKLQPTDPDEPFSVTARLHHEGSRNIWAARESPLVPADEVTTIWPCHPVALSTIFVSPSVNVKYYLVTANCLVLRVAISSPFELPVDVPVLVDFLY